ncbi:TRANSMEMBRANE FRAGILE-X-F-ASSOCIATED PROTEIN [Salix koriyanagi]|uniref:TRANSMEMBRANE FRAGILE-X-F-ASSOCIATED PROTEIN n=1 Tax=Salix koriyanagi TaxID=2511006 RepID=A0A9Q0WDA2_9ROSI|nr:TRANSMEMBRANE FRAGILE-X-F-ASSOCIATED PROTEIN [Salix koriyanagi]
MDHTVTAKLVLFCSVGNPIYTESLHVMVPTNIMNAFCFSFSFKNIAGDVGSLGWWDLFINFSIAECFAFLVCTKWSNPVIHRNSQTREDSLSSTTIRYLDWNGGLMVSPEENQHQDGMCGLQDIGGHIMKIPLIGFQVLLCMHLEGTPAGARNIPLLVLFSPLFLLQGAGVLFAASKLAEKLILLLKSEAGTGSYFRFSSRAHDCMGFLHHGSRLLGWWSIDEGSQEEQARLYHGGDAGLNSPLTDFSDISMTSSQFPGFSFRNALLLKWGRLT